MVCSQLSLTSDKIYVPTIFKLQTHADSLSMRHDMRQYPTFNYHVEPKKTRQQSTDDNKALRNWQ